MWYRVIVIAGLLSMGGTLEAQETRSDSAARADKSNEVMAAAGRHDAESRLAKDADNSSLPWVLWTSQGQYFAAPCTGAWQIPADRRLYVRDEITLRRLGYVRASAQREDCTVNQVIDHADRLRTARRR